MHAHRCGILVLLAAFAAAALPFPDGPGKGAGAKPVRSPEVAGLLRQLDVARWRESEEEMRRLAEKFSELAKERPADAEPSYAAACAHNGLLNLYVLRDKKDRARQELDLAMERINLSIQIDDARAEAFALRAELYGWKVGLANPLARPFSAMGNAGKIKDDLARALKLGPENPAVYISLGMEDYYKPAAVGGDMSRAEKHFTKATELDPESIDAWMWLALAQKARKKNAEAKTALGKVLEFDPENVRGRRELALLK